MTKVLHCRDAGFDCNTVVRGETTQDILRQVRAHARERHQAELTPELEGQVRPLIHEG